MNEFTAWMQSNWYELGNLSVEIVFLSTGIWFARKILKSIRASQEQVGALIRLSVGGAVPERQVPSAIAERPEPVADRKSTRLNSSHVKISYAVFCLKKKKTR